MSSRPRDHQALKAILNTTVIVSALGYFVDIYDLVLFSIVRVASLKELGVPDDRQLEVGIHVLNMQMTGMLVGGLLWGVLGDKKGRISVLFGSIILYSLANIANAFASSTAMYGWLRFLAGVGLAGELGAAITLVSESLPKDVRGFGTSFVAGFGVSGAMLAAVVARAFDWKAAFIIGGALGLGLLVLRVKLFESGLYAKVKEQSGVRRGDLLMLVRDGRRLVRYLCCILIGVPLWFVIGVLVSFAPEICQELGATGKVSAGTGILFAYGGLVVGDIGSGLISQWAKSRKKIVFAFIAATTALILVFLSTTGGSPELYYALCVLLGIACGYWALFATVAAEQFGTNLRATVAITAPNFVRGSVVLVSLLVQTLKADHGLVWSARWVGVGCALIAAVALPLTETFGRELDFIEE